MIFYLGVVGILVVLAVILRPNLSSACRARYAFASFATLSTFAAIRAPSVGADTFQYYRYYTIIGSLDWKDHSTLRFESGYFLLNKLIFTISKNPQIFIAITNIFVIAVIIWFIWKYSKNMLFSVVLYIFLQGYAVTMSALRQSIAMAIVLAVIPMLLRRKYWRFFWGILAATQFHLSAVVLLVLVPLGRTPLKIKLLLLNALSAGVLAVEAGGLVAYAGTTDTLRYGGYAASYLSGSSGVLLTLVFYLGLMSVLTSVVLKHQAAEPDFTSALTFFCYSSWLIIPALGLALGSNAFLRFAVYFVPFIAVFVPDALMRVRTVLYRAFLSYGVAAGTLAYFVAISALRPEWYAVIPYRTVFN